jgi:hypothetical protein
MQNMLRVILFMKFECELFSRANHKEVFDRANFHLELF